MDIPLVYGFVLAFDFFFIRPTFWPSVILWQNIGGMKRGAKMEQRKRAKLLGMYTLTNPKKLQGVSKKKVLS